LRYLAIEAVVTSIRAGKAPIVLIDSGNAIADASFAVSRFHEFSPDDLNRDPEIRDLLRVADSSLDTTVRKSSYSKAFRLIADRAYVLPLTSLPVYYVSARDLTFTPHADGILRFYEMSWK
jgi:peptide/nickel transport system substrate-binding protein